MAIINNYKRTLKVNSTIYQKEDVSIEINSDRVVFNDGFVKQDINYSEITSPTSANITDLLDLLNDWVNSNNEVNSENSSTTALSNGATFTGEWVDVSSYPSIILTCKTDQNGIFRLQYSTDGVNIDSTLTRYYFTDQIEPPHRFTNTRKYARVQFENNSGANQTFFRFQTLLGFQNDLNTPADSVMAQDYDATSVRPTDFNSEVALGLRQGRTLWNKFGYNLDSDVGTEIIASFGGAFNPNTAIMQTAQTFTIAYNNATDGFGTTGALSLLFTYLDADFISKTAIHTLGSTGSETTSFTGLGINRVIVLSNGGLGWNANDITITATIDTTHQAQLPALTSVTQQMIFHTQINHTFLADYLTFSALKPSGGGSGNGFIVGYSWSRVTNTRYEVFRKPYSTSTTEDYNIEIIPSQKFPIGGREVLFFVIENTAGNNTQVSGRFSGIEYKNQIS